MEKKTNNPAITKSYAKKMETISPFELKNKLIDMADESIKKIAHTMLNAGRGNPNWIATEPREAFFLLGQFGLCECRHAFSLEEGIAGIPQKAGIAARFEAFLKENEKAPGANLLKEGYNYMLMEHAADPDTLIHEWAESVIGDQYPVPDRILHFTELIVQDYLAQEMCDRRPPKGTFDLFATEGGTAAMCYLFDSLQENFLLNQGDAIALMIPVFTPYIEIPELRRYQFDVTEISAACSCVSPLRLRSKMRLSASISSTSFLHSVYRCAVKFSTKQTIHIFRFHVKLNCLEGINCA